jgi:uncharacterized protein (TIGR03083 family)
MIHTIDLFEPLDGLLLDLLRSLSRADWSRPTIAGAWTVRDVVAHLLDTPLRRLSFVRDGCMPDSTEAASDLIAFVNALNADGVRTYGRLSPAVLIDLLALVTAQLRDHLRSIDPHAPAAFPVSWAGQSSSAHWFDVAREYTERWHHQAQIRLAVDQLPPLMVSHLHAPVVATFMRAIPYALRMVAADDGTCVSVVVAGEGGGAWTVARRAEAWRLDDGTGASGPFAATVVIPADLAWRLFTKGLPEDAVARHWGPGSSESCPYRRSSESGPYRRSVMVCICSPSTPDTTRRPARNV